MPWLVVGSPCLLEGFWMSFLLFRIVLTKTRQLPPLDSSSWRFGFFWKNVCFFLWEFLMKSSRLLRLRLFRNAPNLPSQERSAQHPSPFQTRTSSQENSPPPRRTFPRVSSTPPPMTTPLSTTNSTQPSSFSSIRDFEEQRQLWSTIQCEWNKLVALQEELNEALHNLEWRMQQNGC